MLQTATNHLTLLIDELTTALAAGADSELTARALRQTLALLHAASETLEELERSRARARPPQRPVTASPKT